MQNAGQQQMMEHMKNRVNDMLKQADLMGKQIALTKRMYEIQQEITDVTLESIGTTRDMSAIMLELRDNIADFDDFWRPLRNYLYWEPHCYNIPICWSLRSMFDSLDSVDEISDKMQSLVQNLGTMEELLPQLLAADEADDRDSGVHADHAADDAQHHVRNF